MGYYSQDFLWDWNLLKAWQGLKDLLARWLIHMLGKLGLLLGRGLSSSPCEPLHMAAWVSSWHGAQCRLTWVIQAWLGLSRTVFYDLVLEITLIIFPVSYRLHTSVLLNVGGNCIKFKCQGFKIPGSRIHGSHLGGGLPQSLSHPWTKQSPNSHLASIPSEIAMELLLHDDESFRWKKAR